MTDTSPADDRESVDDSESAPPTRRARNKRRPSFLRDLVIIVVVAIIASALVKAFIVKPYYIPSGSMENTLQVNDRILVNELEPNLFSMSRGDVVVFHDPGGWLPPVETKTLNPIEWVLQLVGIQADPTDDILIKRVIGLPGDHVTCCNSLGQTEVNGVGLKEPYVKLPSKNAPTSQPGNEFDVTVPAGKIWVEGDNRYDSADSREHRQLPSGGFVPIKNVVGRAILVTWPISRWAWLDNYSSTFDGVEKKSALPQYPQVLPVAGGSK